MYMYMWAWTTLLQHKRQHSHTWYTHTCVHVHTTRRKELQNSYKNELQDIFIQPFSYKPVVVGGGGGFVGVND